jgi:hypothetical protein
MKGPEMSFNGACHCGAVKFTVDAELPAKALSCNCSICRQKGLLLSFFPASQFAVTGEVALTAYEFNTGVFRTWGKLDRSAGASAR